MNVPVWLAALVLVVVGGAFLVAGYRLYRLLIPIWGFFAGFELTLAVARNLTHVDLLASLGGWLFALLVGLIFAALAYAYYYVSVVLLSGTFGFWLGDTIGGYFMTRPSLGILIAGAIGAIVLAAVAIALNLPRWLMIALTALGGAGVIVVGVLVALGQVSLTDLQVSADSGAVMAVRGSWPLTVVTVALALIGFAIQTGRLRPIHYVHRVARRVRGAPLWPTRRA